MQACRSSARCPPPLRALRATRVTRAIVYGCEGDCVGTGEGVRGASPPSRAVGHTRHGGIIRAIAVEGIVFVVARVGTVAQGARHRVQNLRGARVWGEKLTVVSQRAHQRSTSCIHLGVPHLPPFPIPTTTTPPPPPTVEVRELLPVVVRAAPVLGVGKFLGEMNEPSYVAELAGAC